MVNVAIYGIHGSYGIGFSNPIPLLLNTPVWSQWNVEIPDKKTWFGLGGV